MADTLDNDNPTPPSKTDGSSPAETPPTPQLEPETPLANTRALAPRIFLAVVALIVSVLSLLFSLPAFLERHIGPLQVTADEALPITTHVIPTPSPHRALTFSFTIVINNTGSRPHTMELRDATLSQTNTDNPPI